MTFVAQVPGYTACECKASNETCITPYGEHIHKLCSGHGTCECGECKCVETEEGQYSGKYCEDCPVSIGVIEPRVFNCQNNSSFYNTQFMKVSSMRCNLDVLEVLSAIF